MSEPIPVQTPGGFAPGFALGQDDGTGHFVLVGSANPLPTVAAPPEVPAPLAGTSAVALLDGPYAPAAFAPVYIALSGAWQGSVRLLRSTDDGATLHPLTMGGGPWGLFTANACEPLWQESEAGATLWLSIAPTEGTVTFRVSQ